MKLCVITPEFGASFIELHLSDIWPDETIGVAIFDHHPHTQYFSKHVERHIPTIQLDCWTRRLPVRLARRMGLDVTRLIEMEVKRFLLRHNVKVVLGEYLDEFLPFVPLMERMGLPYVVQGHGVDVSAVLRREGMADRYLAYRSARAVLTRSEFHRQRLIDIGLDPRKVHVNRGGVVVPPEPVRRLPEAGKRLLAIGRLVPKKGPFYLLEAFRRAAARDPELRLDYIGGGPEAWAMRQLVDAAGLDERVRLHGTVPEPVKQSLIAECGVFVQHSLTDPDNGDEEGLPAAIQEAMAAGMAVVTTRHAGIPEAVIDRETGLLVDERDVAGMAQAFIDVGPCAAALGLAGHARALAHDAWPLERARLKTWLFG